MRDWENLACIAGVVVIAALVVVLKPDGPLLAVAGTAVGGCLTHLQRRAVP